MVLFVKQRIMFRDLKTQPRRRGTSSKRQPDWSVNALEPRLMLAADAGTQVAAEVSSESAGQSQERMQSVASHSIVFVDQSLDDIDTLIEGVADPSAEIIIIAGEGDGVAQISAVLANRQNVQSIHLLTHGSEGMLQLGDAKLDSQSLAKHADQFQVWKRSLASEADILLYGCNVAAGPLGEAFVDQLARLTGADVASSNDITGSSIRHADWDLEYHVGDIETAVAFHAAPLQRYQGILKSNVRSQTIEIYAAGETGEENLDIFIDGEYATTFFGVGGDVGQREFERFVYETDQPVSADQISVAFGNDAYDPATGFDRNLVVDRIVLGGVTFETEDPSTSSTGIWRDGLTGSGNYETETLNINSIFTFSSGDNAEPTGQIAVEARGETGDEVFQVLVDGNVLGEFNVDTDFDTYTVAVEDDVAADRVRIAFVNDLFDPSGGIDRNLIVQTFDVNGDSINPFSNNVFSTGTFLESDGIASGFGRGNTLNANGYFQVSDEGPTRLGTQIRFDARGTTESQVVRVTTRTGEVLGQVEVDRGFPTRFTPAFREFVISTDRDIQLEDIRLEFISDGSDEFGQDRNVQIGAVLVENLDTGRIQRTTAIDSQTFSTGVFLPEDGVQPGFGRGDTLAANGYFEFQESSRVKLNVFGSTGSEQYDVFIGGEKRATFDVGEPRVLDLDESVDDKEVRIEFINDGLDDQGEDRNLRVASIEIDGRIHQANLNTVETSGQFEGFAQVNLFENGFVQFGVDDPGDVRISASSFVIQASQGFVNVRLERFGELDSPLTFQWTATPLFNDFPLAQDSGIVVMREDQLRVPFNVPFANTTSTGTFDVQITSLTPGVDLFTSIARFTM